MNQKNALILENQQQTYHEQEVEAMFDKQEVETATDDKRELEAAEDPFNNHYQEQDCAATEDLCSLDDKSEPNADDHNVFGISHVRKVLLISSMNLMQTTATSLAFECNVRKIVLIGISFLFHSVDVVVDLME